MYTDVAVSRITARVLLGPLVCAGLLSCSSSHKPINDTGFGAATRSSSAAPSSSTSVAATTQSPGFTAGTDVGMVSGADTTRGTTTPGSAADTAAAPSGAASSVAVHQSRADRRVAHGTTRPGAGALKRQGTRCVPLASNALARTDFSNSPATINPCGLGSMNLPTMAPPNVANPR